MKIIFFDFAGPYYPGGCEKYLTSLSKVFSNKWEVLFMHSKQYVRFTEYVYHFIAGHTIGSTKYAKRDIGNVTVENISFSTILPLTKNNREIIKLLQSADIIYAKNEFQELLVLYVLLGKKMYSKKVIVGTHTAIFLPDYIKGIWKFIHDLEYKSFLYKMFLNNAKHIHVPNSDYVKLLKENYKVPSKKITFIPYSVDWSTNYYRKEKSEKFTILWAGRLTSQKGLDRLEKIIDNMSYTKYFDKINFLIAGDGEYKAQVEKLQKKHKNVKYLGYQNDMSSLYKISDISIITSYWETFGYNALEPQSFGIPVISFNISGPRDIISPKTGFLVRDENEFLNKIIYIFELKDKDFTQYSEMRHNIYKYINTQFSKEKIFNEMQKLLSNHES